MQISRIRLRNIRAFREMDLDLRDKGGSPRLRTLIIGRNGTCKTTLLRSIVLGLCDATDATALLKEHIGGMVSEGARLGEIEIEMMPPEGGDPILLRQVIERQGEDKEGALAPIDRRASRQPFVCAYGAGRFGIGSETGREYRIADSAFTLFNYRQTLMDTELTLRRLQDFLGSAKYERTLMGIKRALSLPAEAEILLPPGGGIELSSPAIGRRVRLDGWADGYRMTFTWLLDLYGWAMRADRINDDGFIEGIVLVDELEQHLHPSMQTEILPQLQAVLPRAQIFATTHSPLIALGAKPAELVVLRREGDLVQVEEDVPNFSGYSAKDMLLDERLFDTEAYGPEARLKISRYHELAAIPDERRSEAERQELRKLASEVREYGVAETDESAALREIRRLVEKHGL